MTIVGLIALGHGGYFYLPKVGMNSRRDMRINLHPEMHPKRMLLRLIVTNGSVGDASYATDLTRHGTPSAFTGAAALKGRCPLTA